jgi:hypothetical protein
MQSPSLTSMCSRSPRATSLRLPVSTRPPANPLECRLAFPQVVCLSKSSPPPTPALTLCCCTRRADERPAVAFPRTLRAISGAAVRLALKRKLLRMARTPNSADRNILDDEAESLPPTSPAPVAYEASNSIKRPPAVLVDDEASHGRLDGLEKGLKSLRKELSAQGVAQSRALEKLTEHVFEIRAAQMTMQDAILRLADDRSKPPDSSSATPRAEPSIPASSSQRKSAEGNVKLRL